MLVFNFNAQATFGYKRLLHAAMYFIIGGLLLCSGFAIKLYGHFNKEVSVYQYLLKQNRQQHVVIKRLDARNPLLVSHDRYQQLVQAHNQRVKYFIWLKSWCDHWLCMNSVVSPWLKISIHYDPAQQKISLEWMMLFQQSKQAQLFLTWLKKTLLLDQAAITSIEPQENRWAVHFTGQKSL
jgi:hypothetical protein